MGHLRSLYTRYGSRPLRAYWWRHGNPRKLNFGDELTPFIVERVFQRRCAWSAPEACEFAAAGSIIEILAEQSRGNAIRVWGSGFIHDDAALKVPANLEFHAVRGPLSQARVAASGGLVLGDPGLLMNRAVPTASRPTRLVGLVPHYVDQDHPLVKSLVERCGAFVINVLNAPEVVARDVASCSLILSSSLHGLIVSDSYGIPNYHVRLNELVGGGYKFADYYASLGVEHATVDPASIHRERELHDLINRFVSRHDAVQALQQGLADAFPFQ